MRNTPKSVLAGWSILAVCALGGYLGSKAYTNNRLREYTTNGGFGRSQAASTTAENQATTEDNQPLRRSVQRTL